MTFLEANSVIELTIEGRDPEVIDRGHWEFRPVSDKPISLYSGQSAFPEELSTPRQLLLRLPEQFVGPLAQAGGGVLVGPGGSSINTVTVSGVRQVPESFVLKHGLRPSIGWVAVGEVVVDEGV